MNRQEDIRRIPAHEWNEAARVAIADIRKERASPNWLPTFLNGRDEFERRVLDLIKDRKSFALPV